jgi:hypothetical protein
MPTKEPIPVQPGDPVECEGELIVPGIPLGPCAAWGSALHLRVWALVEWKLELGNTKLPGTRRGVIKVHPPKTSQLRICK